VLAKSGGGKTDITKVGLNSIENDTVKQNLMGKSRYMEKKGWVDSQGRKGKVRVPGLLNDRRSS
jgi:photosystem II protein